MMQGSALSLRQFGQEGSDLKTYHQPFPKTRPPEELLLHRH